MEHAERFSLPAKRKVCQSKFSTPCSPSFLPWKLDLPLTSRRKERGGDWSPDFIELPHQCQKPLTARRFVMLKNNLVFVYATVHWAFLKA